MEGTVINVVGNDCSWSGGGITVTGLLTTSSCSITGDGDTSMLSGSALSVSATAIFLPAILCSLAILLASTMSEVTTHLSMSPCSTVTPLTKNLRSEDLHQVVGELTSSKIKTDNSMGKGITFI